MQVLRECLLAFLVFSFYSYFFVQVLAPRQEFTILPIEPAVKQYEEIESFGTKKVHNFI